MTELALFAWACFVSLSLLCLFEQSVFEASVFDWPHFVCLSLLCLFELALFFFEFAVLFEFDFCLIELCFDWADFLWLNLLCLIEAALVGWFCWVCWSLFWVAPLASTRFAWWSWAEFLVQLVWACLGHPLDMRSVHASMHHVFLSAFDMYPVCSSCLFAFSRSILTGKFWSCPKTLTSTRFGTTNATSTPASTGATDSTGSSLIGRERIKHKQKSLQSFLQKTRSTNPRKPAKDPSVAPGRQPSKI